MLAIGELRNGLNAIMNRTTRVFFGLCLVVVCLIASTAIANALQSNNYQFDETSLGGLGLTNGASANYQALQSGGILGLGNSASNTLQVNNGHETTNDPALTFSVDNGSVNFGNFSPGSAATSTSSFEVIDYTSFGYIVQVFGTPPTNGTHTIAAMSTTAPSQAGVEQFGMNLVANTSPISLGANPNHGQFGFGSASSNYGTSNNYRFVSGETIASAPKSSGDTIYTISYIVNVDDFTPGGQYSGNQTILCTATF
jgi:hypothetical protein